MNHHLLRAATQLRCNRWHQIRTIAEKITFPALSPTMTEGRIAQWKKKAGDAIKPGEILASVETDKATLDWEWAGDEGYIAQVVSIDGTINVGDEIGVWVEEQAELADAAKLVLGGKAAAGSAPASQPTPVVAETPAASTPPTPEVAAVSAEVKALVERSGPAVQKLFHDRPGLDVSAVKPSGKGGRFTKADLLNAPEGPAKVAVALLHAASVASTAQPGPAEPMAAAKPKGPSAPAAEPIRAVQGQRRFAVDVVAGQRRVYVL